MHQRIIRKLCVTSNCATHLELHGDGDILISIGGHLKLDSVQANQIVDHHSASQHSSHENNQKTSASQGKLTHREINAATRSILSINLIGFISEIFANIISLLDLTVKINQEPFKKSFKTKHIILYDCFGILTEFETIRINYSLQFC